MDTSTASRNPSNAGRSPRLQTQLSSDQTPSDNKKSPVISPGADSTGTKAFGFLIKTSSTPARESGTVVTGTSPKMLKNITDKSPLQESTKKANRTSQVNKSRDAALPHLNDDKSKMTGSFVDDNQRDLESVDKLANLSNVRDNSTDAENHQKFPGRKLPTIINKKILQKSDQKRSPMKKTSTERNASVLGLGKGEIDMIISPKSPNQQRITIQLSNSPVMKSPIVDRKSSNKTVGGAEDEVIMVGTRKLYAEDKNRPSLNIENLRAKYVSPPAKTVHTNVSGGEEDDERKGGSPLMISPMRGAQRTAKPVMKKIELSRNRRVGSPESKDRSVDVIDLRKLSKKKPETSKVESTKKVSKKKEEANSASYRENGGKVAKEEKVEKVEKAEKKKKAAAQAEDEMDGWGKSEDSESKDLGDEEEEEENKEENKEVPEGTSPRRDEKQVEVEKEKPKDQVKEEKEKEKTKEKAGNSSAKKPGVASPRMNKEVKNNKKMLEANLGIITAGKDPMQVKREQAYKEFMQKLNFSFNVQVKIPTEKTFTSYKYFLGKGNNSIMIKAMMKQRWWWTHVDNKDAADINFIWTQLKQNSFIGGLKQKRKSPFDNLEWSGVSSHAGDTTANTTTTIDSITDCESDNTDGETKVVVKKSKKSSQAKAGKGGKMKRSSTVAVDDKSLQDIAASSMKKLFTDNEIMLMNSVSGNKGNGVIYPEDYEELGKMRKGPSLHVISDPSNMKMCNHLENNFHLANKKALLWNMKSYYEAVKQNVFDYLPLTFHVRNGFDDKEYHRFIEYYSAREKEIQEQEEAKDGKKAGKKLKNIWIVKPGENTNRGVGIHVCDSLSQINELVATTEGKTDSKKRTYLIQQYLDKPLLYNKRKFDIRCYILMTCINGMMKGYWYQDGYIRTASKEFSLKNVTNKFVHLTNDAVQKKAEDYGKFESGNKLSYNDFQKYLDAHHEGNVNFNNDIYPQIKQLATDAIKGVYGKIDPYRRENCFEVFGLDFMIDANLKAWLIEVNTNPDINASSPVLTRVIPPMVENALRLTIDQMYPPPAWAMNKKQMLPENLLENNKFELVFDEVEDGPALRSILQPEKGATGDLILEIVAEEAEEDGEEEVKE